MKSFFLTHFKRLPVQNILKDGLFHPPLHFLRDIKDTTVGTLSQRITNQVHGLKGLNSKLLDIRSYLERVAAGKLPINHQIIYQLQDVFNLLPDVNLLVSSLCLWGCVSDSCGLNSVKLIIILIFWQKTLFETVAK